MQSGAAPCMPLQCSRRNPASLLGASSYFENGPIRAYGLPACARLRPLPSTGGVMSSLWASHARNRGAHGTHRLAGPRAAPVAAGAPRAVPSRQADPGCDRDTMGGVGGFELIRKVARIAARRRRVRSPSLTRPFRSCTDRTIGSLQGVRRGGPSAFASEREAPSGRRAPSPRTPCDTLCAP